MRIDGHGNVTARRVICTMFVLSRDVVLGKKVVVETDAEFESWTCQTCSFIPLSFLGPPKFKELDLTLPRVLFLSFLNILWLQILLAYVFLLLLN